MDSISALENFLTYLRLHKGRSLRTLEQYEFHLWRLFTFLDKNLREDKEIQKEHRKIFLSDDEVQRERYRDIRRELRKKSQLKVEDIKKSDIDEFRMDLARDTLSVKSINAHIITFRSWLKYLKKEGISCLDPTVLDLMKPPEREVTFLTDDEIVRFFKSIDQSNIQGIRDYAICQCIYSTGLRISELTALDIRDVNLETMEFAVRGKGNKIRVVYLTEIARDAIRTYLHSRSDNFAPLFLRHNFREENIKSIDLDNESVRLSRFFITTMVKDYGMKAGILKNLHAHTLRHSFATTLLTNGADIRIIQELLGHASITTTQVYTHVTNPKLKEAHKKFHK